MFRLFKQKPPSVRLDAPLDHPILGRLEPHDKLPGVLRGFAMVGEAEIDVWVTPDGDPLQAALQLAADAVSRLMELDGRCRMLIAADRLASYKSDWRFGAIVQADGTTKDFEKPLFTVAQFAAKLTPTTLEITGSDVLAFRYSDDDMFWGHSLCLTSFNGVALSDVSVEIQG